jgi:hypothetical protein
MSSPLASAKACRFGEIYLHTESESFDLHNNFDFIDVAYDPHARIARLRWTRNEYALAEQPHSLIAEFRGVTHFSATPRDADTPFSEDTCVADIGGIEPSERTVPGIYSDVPSGWHHVFTLMSGFVLRVGAESVLLLPNDI